MSQDFYVYIHRKATTGEVFYVGKGTGDRAFSSSLRGAQWVRTSTKHGLRVEIVQDGLQEWAAFELERDLIALYGRRDLGLGPLVNLTDGGEGPSGHRHTPSAKQKSRMAAASAWQNPDHRARVMASWDRPGMREMQSQTIRRARSDPAVKSRIASTSKMMWSRPEYREKIEASIRASWANQESRARRIASLSEAIRKDRAQPVLCVEAQRVFQTVVDAAQWLRGNGWPKASSPNITTCCKGRVKTAYGYTWRYAQAA